MTPQQLPILQKDILDCFTKEQKTIKDGDDAIEFNAFTLLDPTIKNQQIFAATHICYGMYHAGVVCNDVDTNIELTQLPQALYDILDEFKAFLLKCWMELEKQNDNQEVQLIMEQYNIKQKQFIDSQTAVSKTTKWGMTASSIINKKGVVSEQLKIEYMLRFFSRNYIASSFPYVPLGFLKDLMINQAQMQISKDEKNYKKLFAHFQTMADTIMNQTSFRNAIIENQKKSEYFKKLNPNLEFVNLKELRDQMLRHRCGNGKLFMYGCSNDGRLGVAFAKQEESKGEIDTKEWKMETKGLQNVIFPDPKLIVAKVECGSSFTLVLSSNGLLFSWGFGKSGSLGLGEKSFCPTPNHIEKTYSNANCENIVDISCGSSHSLAIDNSGNIYSWGNGQGGRLGHNQEVGENSPRIIEELQGKFIKVIEAGDASSACITHDNIVYMWGSGLNGRLGNGTLSNVLVPEISMELKKKQVKQIIKGNNSTFCILESGKVFGWGSSKNGKLGLQLPQGKNYELPREIVSLEGKEIYQIASGPFHTLCLTMHGKIEVMGNSKDGKLGILMEEGSVYDVELPEPVHDLILNMEDKTQNLQITFFQHKVVKTIMKHYALFDDYDDFSRLRPIIKKDLPFEIIQVKCGQNFLMMVTNNGELWATGSNKYGQLGTQKEDEKLLIEKEEQNNEEKLKQQIRKLEKRQDVLEPVRVFIGSNLKRGNKVKQIAIGSLHCAAIIEGEHGGVYSWGKNSHGQLGVGKKEDFFFEPQQIKGLCLDNYCKQIALGENHSVFLMSNNMVFTCGSNEFGQLGLLTDATGGEENALGGRDQESTPQPIGKQFLDNVVYIAAGKYHTIVIRQTTEGDKFDEEDEKDDVGAMKMRENNDNPIVTIDINHEVYSWGRAYHGQLGLKGCKNVQWTPKKVKIKKDPRLQDEDQPTRFAMVSCGQKFSMLLAMNGMMWFSGDKKQVGLFQNETDPLAKNKSLQAEAETKSFQYTFMPFTDPHKLRLQPEFQMKFVACNFNSRQHLAINAANDLFEFGEDNPLRRQAPLSHTEERKDGKAFEKESGSNKYVLADCGGGFAAAVAQQRVPFTWGDFKNGKLGILHSAVKEGFPPIPQYDKKTKLLTSPVLIPQMNAYLRQNYSKKDRDEKEENEQFGKISDKEIAMLNAIYLKQEFNISVEKSISKQAFELRFHVQKTLKLTDQAQLEQDLLQQDTDLILKFRSCIDAIYQQHQQADREIRNSLMNAQDSIHNRIQRFPVQNLDKLEDIEVQIPKIIILNKQIYEVMFTLLQTHPCYLINWICAAISGHINLFDDHPLAFLDDEFRDKHKDVDYIVKAQEQYLNKSEQQIMIDEYCYLLLAAFGGFKTIRNDKRIVSNLVVIASKVLEFEINQDENPQNKLEYSFDDILHNRVDCGYMRIHRLVFHSQFQNMAFIEELFELIVKRLQMSSKKYDDGIGTIADRKDIFDYEAVIKNEAICDLRASNLVKFLKDIIENVIAKNIDPEKRKRHQIDCKHNFTHELLLLTLKADKIIAEKAAQRGLNNIISDQTARQRAIFEDQQNQVLLRALLEDLCARLQSVKPHDIIRILGSKDPNIMKKEPVLNVEHKRNNFHLLGAALRNLLSEGKFYFSFPALLPYKEFVEQDGVAIRKSLAYLIRLQKSEMDINQFRNLLIQQGIEQAMELQNSTVTVQLRNVVYLHNQLVQYGEKYIYLEGFESKSAQKQVRLELDGNSSEEPDDEEYDSEENSEGAVSEEETDKGQAKEMDPLKIIMHAFGNQTIVLKVFSQEFISQEKLNKSINFQIQTKIFEHASMVIRCSGCNALAYEGILPRKRVHEGIFLKEWQCTGNKKCGHWNANSLALVCQKCYSVRPRDTISNDLIFELFRPADKNLAKVKNAEIMEKLLIMLPPIDAKQKLVDIVTEIKAKEKAKEENKNFDKINLIDNFLKLRANYIQEIKQATNNRRLQGNEEKSFEELHENELYDSLCDEIQRQIDRRKHHQVVIEKNVQMIREINDRFNYIQMSQKKFIASLVKISQNAVKGCGTPEILQFLLQSEQSGGSKNNVQICAGRLQDMEKDVQENKNKGKKQMPQKSQLDSYFENMDKKQNLVMTQQKLQRKLEENKGRRNIMKSQFGQFSSFPAQKLIEQEVIESIQIGNKKMDPMVIKKCNYLFYEIKGDSTKDGGYKIELSFEEKQQAFCDIGKITEIFLNEGTKNVGSNNQSILSTFNISNETLMEMRRVMASKVTVNLGGTVFNIFKLVRMINNMKSSMKSAMPSNTDQ